MSPSDIFLDVERLIFGVKMGDNVEIIEPKIFFVFLFFCLKTTKFYRAIFGKYARHAIYKGCRFYASVLLCPTVGVTFREHFHVLSLSKCQNFPKCLCHAKRRIFFGFKLLNESIPLVSCFPSSVKSRTVLFSRLKGKFLAIKLVFDLNSIFLTEIFSGFFGVAPYFEFMPPLDLTFDFRRKLGRLGNSTFYEFSRVRNFSVSDVNYRRKKWKFMTLPFAKSFRNSALKKQ